MVIFYIIPAFCLGLLLGFIIREKQFNQLYVVEYQVTSTLKRVLFLMERSDVMSDGVTNLEAIEGLVRSEPLNRNFSALDSEIGYAAGYISGDTTLHYDDGIVTGVTTPVSEISLEYNNEGVLTEVIEEFKHRTVETSLIYDSEGVLTTASKEVTEK